MLNPSFWTGQTDNSDQIDQIYNFDEDMFSKSVHQNYLESEMSLKLNELKIFNLSKSFGENKIINNVNLRIREGEIFALLGHNGAGKTTLINIINGMFRATNGVVL